VPIEPRPEHAPYIAAIANVVSTPTRALLPFDAQPPLSPFAQAATVSTCRICSTPVVGYPHCQACNGRWVNLRAQLADRVLPLSYALDASQMYRDLRQYKEDPPRGGPGTPSFGRLACLLYLTGYYHGHCINAISIQPISMAAVVPSTGGRINHPLPQLVRHLWPGPVAGVTYVENTDERRRAYRPEHFRIDAPVTGAHVLLLDDTWVTGSASQSVAGALKLAGAAEVTIMALGRFLRSDWEPNQQFIAAGALANHYDLNICPATQGPCPPPRANEVAPN